MIDDSSGKIPFKMVENHVYEGLISVYDEGMAPYFSPVGIYYRKITESKNLTLEAKIYPTSGIYSLIKSRKECLIHFPDASQLEFFFFGFKDELKGYLAGLKQNLAIERSMVVDAPRIISIENFIEAKVTNVAIQDVNDPIASNDRNNSTIGIFLLESKAIHVNNVNFQPVTRYSGLFMECLINLSRLKYLPPESEIYTKKLEKINYFLLKMKKIFPGEEKNEILDLLSRKIQGKRL